MRKTLTTTLLLFSFLAFSQLTFAQLDKKALHVGAGFGITIGVSSLTHRPSLGLAAGIGAGIAKEVWDSQHRGHDASFRDVMITSAGSGAAFVLWKYGIARKKPKIAAVPSQTPPQTSMDKKPETTAPPAVTLAKGSDQK